MSSVLKKYFNDARDFAAQYPAVLSGYIIYSYLFITIMHFFLKAKHTSLTAYDIYSIFDALPFMWLLAVALVKIIEIRNKLHVSEKERLVASMEMQLKKTQLDTLREVARSFQHHINNPLAIITLALSQARREAKQIPELSRRLEAIQDSARRISQAVDDFMKSDSYHIDHIESVGDVTTLPKTTDQV
jgi:signal transduction histidine kinase